MVVMAEKGRELLRTIYQVAEEKIEIIPHGIPEFAFVEPDDAKNEARLCRQVCHSDVRPAFASYKGIEFMIDAMPSILSTRPGAVYVVLGATHPNLVHDEGETYRESLIAGAREAGVS